MKIKQKFEFAFKELTPLLSNEEVKRLYFEDFMNTIKNSYYPSELKAKENLTPKKENQMAKTSQK